MMYTSCFEKKTTSYFAERGSIFIFVNGSRFFVGIEIFLFVKSGHRI